MPSCSARRSLLLLPGSARCFCRHSMGPRPCTAAWLEKPRNASCGAGAGKGGPTVQQDEGEGQEALEGRQQVGGLHRPDRPSTRLAAAPAGLQQGAAGPAGTRAGRDGAGGGRVLTMARRPFFSSLRRVSSLRMFRGSKGAKGPRPVCRNRGGQERAPASAGKSMGQGGGCTSKPTPAEAQPVGYGAEDTTMPQRWRRRPAASWHPVRSVKNKL